MVAPKEDSDYPELEKLVQEIKQGKRVVLYPVGMVSFIAVNMLLIASFVTLVLPLLYTVGSDWEMSTQDNSQLFLVVFTTLCIVPPGILITRGKKKLQRWFIFLSAALAISAIIAVISAYVFNIEGLKFRAFGLYICIVTSSLATYLACSARYRALTYFYYFLHKKN